MASIQGAPASHQFTCNSCQVAYRTDQLQKEHMKSDWHRYNLKRRVASLPPITSEVFTEKVLQARAASTAEAEKAAFSKLCDVCQKTYYSENSFRNHLSSQRHRVRRAELAPRPVAAVEKIEDEGSVVDSNFSLGEPLPSEKESVISDEDEVAQVIEVLQKASLVEQPSQEDEEEGDDKKLDKGKGKLETVDETPDTEEEPDELKACLFCNQASSTLALNVSHMERAHGMYIPEKQFLVDLQGLLAHLRERIQEDFECLFCGKFKNSAYAAQTHMRDTAHCKIPYSTEKEQLEIGHFYDFRSTYSDGEDDWEDEDDEDDEDDDKEGWESGSTSSSVATASMAVVKAGRPAHAQNQLVQAVYHDEYELHLPSGKSVGHRSLNRYYRQNLHSHPSPEERAQRQHQLMIEGGSVDDDVRTRNKVRAMVPRGSLGMVGATERQKEVARKSEQRGRALERFQTKQRDWKVSKVLNNHKSYYYRYEGGG